MNYELHVMNEEPVTLDLVETKLREFVRTEKPQSLKSDKGSYSYEYDKNQFIIYVNRPRYDFPNQRIQSPVIRAKYIKTRKVWKLSWMPVIKWHPYVFLPEVPTLDLVLRIVKEDPHGVLCTKH